MLGTEPCPAYGVYIDGHAEALNGYKFHPQTSAALKASSIYADQGPHMSRGLAYIIIRHHGAWHVCNGQVFGCKVMLQHTDLDAALMWASLNL